MKIFGAWSNASKDEAGSFNVGPFGGPLSGKGSGLPHAPPPASPPYRLRLLGDFSLSSWHDDADLTPRCRKARALIAYLACRPDHIASRAKIANLLWSEHGDPQAKASLRQTILRLRKANGGKIPILAVDRQHIRLRTETVAIDIEMLDARAESGDLSGLAAALEECDSEMLTDLDDVAPDFTEWLRNERAFRYDRLIRTCFEAAKKGLQQGDVAASRDVLSCLQRIAPENETLVQLTMRADHVAGDRMAMHKRYRSFVKTVEDDIGAPPAPETVALFEKLSRDPNPSEEPGEGVPPLIPSAPPAISGERRRPLKRRRTLVLATLFLALSSVGLWLLFTT